MPNDAPMNVPAVWVKLPKMFQVDIMPFAAPTLQLLTVPPLCVKLPEILILEVEPRPAFEL